MGVGCIPALGVPPAAAVAKKRLEGRYAALYSHATAPRAYGITSPTNYPLTYWWLVGFNETVAEQQ